MSYLPFGLSGITIEPDDGTTLDRAADGSERLSRPWGSRVRYRIKFTHTLLTPEQFQQVIGHYLGNKFNKFVFTDPRDGTEYLCAHARMPAESKSHGSMYRDAKVELVGSLNV